MADDNKTIRLHFSPCWAEDIWTSENEAKEWLEELTNILCDDTMPVQLRLQKVIDDITSV